MSIGQADLRSIDFTYIALIHKQEDASPIKDFGPINLFNGIHKIVTRILVNRLQGVLHGLVMDSQFTLIKGRSIMDCLLLLKN